MIKPGTHLYFLTKSTFAKKLTIQRKKRKLELITKDANKVWIFINKKFKQVVN